MDDWLDEGEGAREAQRQSAVEFAQAYLVFVDDSRARELLDYWDRTLMNRRVPVDASIQQYAAAEALRAFIAGIHQQIALGREERLV